MSIAVVLYALACRAGAMQPGRLAVNPTKSVLVTGSITGAACDWHSPFSARCDASWVKTESADQLLPWSWLRLYTNRVSGPSGQLPGPDSPMANSLRRASANACTTPGVDPARRVGMRKHEKQTLFGSMRVVPPPPGSGNCRPFGSASPRVHSPGSKTCMYSRGGERAAAGGGGAAAFDHLNVAWERRAVQIRQRGGRVRCPVVHGRRRCHHRQQLDEQRHVDTAPFEQCCALTAPRDSGRPPLCTHASRNARDLQE